MPQLQSNWFFFHGVRSSITTKKTRFQPKNELPKSMATRRPELIKQRCSTRLYSSELRTLLDAVTIKPHPNCSIIKLHDRVNRKVNSGHFNYIPKHVIGAAANT